MANMSAKFDEVAHSGLVHIMFTSLLQYMSIVTLTFDPWPSKPIGAILSLWLTCLPSVIKKHKTVWSLSCSQAYFHIFDLWPLTSKIKRVQPLIIVNMTVKFDEDLHNSLVAIAFTRVWRDALTDWLTDAKDWRNHGSVTISPLQVVAWG